MLTRLSSRKKEKVEEFGEIKDPEMTKMGDDLYKFIKQVLFRNDCLDVGQIYKNQFIASSLGVLSKLIKFGFIASSEEFYNLMPYLINLSNTTSIKVKYKSGKEILQRKMLLDSEFTQRYKKTGYNMQIMMIVDRVNLIILQIMDFNENEILHHFLDRIQPIMTKESKELK